MTVISVPDLLEVWISEQKAAGLSVAAAILGALSVLT